MNYKDQSGFTLVEMLIVILVIAALSVILISIIDPQASQGRARDGVRMNNVKNISEGIESYRQLEGSYPDNSDPSDEDSTLMKTYIKKWPDPLADDGSMNPDNAYVYVQAGSGFILRTLNATGGCYKYQTDWSKVLECPIAECTNSISLASDCN
ncbi:type II secretion system protein [candidate division WWE3 bacterium]|jgi:prepilin-type N-terminal cleavage/methylation domain-containing protein|nr:type II secretion system protein [candidate division WWE3 bacterium]MBT7349204.1 type II secretion system protein [candidate division WWE3 bacterium]